MLRDADLKPLEEISEEARSLAERARAKKLQPAEYTGATLSISNLGMMGIEEFSAIINPPEAAILAVGAVRHVPVVVDGALAVGWRMKATLSVDPPGGGWCIRSPVPPDAAALPGAPPAHGLAPEKRGALRPAPGLYSSRQADRTGGRPVAARGEAP